MPWLDFFKKSTDTPETPAQKELRLVIEAYDQMINKLEFIKRDLEPTFKDRGEQAKYISGPIARLETQLLDAKIAYESNSDLEQLKKSWHKTLYDEESGLLAIAVHLKTSSMVYNQVHESIQDFFKWFQSTLQTLGILSDPKAGYTDTTENRPKRKPWIQEQENSAKNIKDLWHFEEGLDETNTPKGKDTKM
ncbi:MAG: hypothetical protein P1U61_02050 [Legionellaceae bacterium]|nr:hypothetical protein [Legionellaceae bacterium]